ncbi:MAG: hypothetical protein Q4E65_09785 [Clostridia bacterium]|nr:hypothetical protein [Clostridia bacterium]
MQKRDRVFSCILLALLLALFGIWAFTGAFTGLGLLVGALSCTLFALVLLRFVPAFTSLLFTDTAPLPDAAFGARTLRWENRHPWLKITLFVLAFRILTYVVAYWMFTWLNGYTGGVWETLKTLWLRTDSPSYLGIAENWYVTEGDARFHLVFFPLYPMCIKAVWYAVGDYFASAMVVSNVFSVASAIACYELTALELPFDEAKRSVRYMLLLPAAFFLAAPMTESLFLFLSLMTLYFARRRRFLFACIFAALAGLSRLPGILLAVPVGLEMLFDLCERYRNGNAFKKKLFAYIGCMLILPLGFAAYLSINAAVTGDAFRFMTYQKEHWDQSMDYFFSASAYQAENILSADARMRWGLYVPNVAACLGALLLMLWGAKGMRPSYIAYFLVYFAITTGATWLLSAPRYLAVCYPLLLACTMRVREPQNDILLTALLVPLFVGYMTMYVIGYPVF